MPRSARCVIPGCHRRNSSTHFFPRDPVRRQQWIDFVKRLNPDFPPPGQYSCICGAHFETHYYNFNFWIDKKENSFGCKNPRRTLSEGAIPTIVGNEIATSLANLLQLPTPGAFNMIQSTPPPGMVTQNGNRTSVETHAESLPATSTMTDATKSNSSGRNYTVVKNQTGQKVCIFRQLAQKPTASVATSCQSVISQSLATTKAATMTTPSIQAVPSVVRLTTPNSVLSQQIIMLQDGAPLKVVKTNTVPKNFENNGKPMVQHTIVKKQPVTSTIVQTPKATLHYKPTTEKVCPIVSKKLFTVDELDKLPKSDFLSKFTSKVKIMDSRNFAVRCQLIKSCPFIISCPSESDCQDVMFLHLKKHIATLRARQEGNRVPYKISTGVKLGSSPLSTAPPETITQEKMNHISTMMGGVGRVSVMENAKSISGQYTLQNGGVTQNAKSASLNLKQSFMKIFPISKVQINPSIANRTMTTTQTPLTARTVIPSVPVVNQASKTPVILDPRNLSIKSTGANGRQMMVQVGKQLKVVQAANGNAGSTTSPNMTFVLVPVTKPTPNVKGPTPSVLRTHPVYGKSTNFPKILRTPINQNRTVLHKGSMIPTISLKSNASPLDITNEMILKAKAVLDRRTAGLANVPAFQVSEYDGPSPSFGLKITLPRLYDLAKHAIMSGDAWNLKLAKFLSHIHSRKPLPKAEIKLKVFARGESNPGTGNSSLGVYMERKNEFLSSRLHLERVGSKKLNERCKQRDIRTRLQRQKLRRQLAKKSADHGRSQKFGHNKLHFGRINNGILQKKRTRKSVLWWTEPEPKRIKFEVVNRRKAVKFKQTKKPQSFWYTTRENCKKASRKDDVDKPLKEILQPGLIVLKRNATMLPQREIESVRSKKTKKCEEVTIGGKVIKIKQEPVSDEESIDEPIDIDDVPDRLLQPPSDDDMDDLFPDDNTVSDVYTTDSESEFCIAKKKAQEDDSPVVSSVTKGPKSEPMEDEVDVPLLAIKYFQRLCEVIRVTRENSSADQPVLLPATLKSCKICSMEFGRVDLLLQHYKHHAGEVQKVRSKDHVDELSSTTSTKLHPKNMKRRPGFKQSKGLYQYEKPFKCELCQKRFYTCKTFEEHLIEKHSHSTKAMAHVLFSRSNNLSQDSNPSICDLMLPDFGIPKKSEDIPTTSRSLLNDLLIENAYQYASDSLECYSPPLPTSPKVGVTSQHATDSSRSCVQTIPAVESKATKAVDGESAAPPGLQPIKLTLFPTNGSGLSRICFANNRKLLES